MGKTIQLVFNKENRIEKNNFKPISGMGMHGKTSWTKEMGGVFGTSMGTYNGTKKEVSNPFTRDKKTTDKEGKKQGGTQSKSGEEVFGVSRY